MNAKEARKTTLKNLNKSIDEIYNILKEGIVKSSERGYFSYDSWKFSLDVVDKRIINEVVKKIKKEGYKIKIKHKKCNEFLIKW